MGNIRLPFSMLSQRSIQLWEGYSSGVCAFRENNVDAKAVYFFAAPIREWKAHLQRRRVRVSPRKASRAVSVVCSQGMQAKPVEFLPRQVNSRDFVRGAGDGRSNPLYLDGDDIRAPAQCATCDTRPASELNDENEWFNHGEGRVDASTESGTEDSSTSAGLVDPPARVSIRTPEGGRPDSDGSETSSINALSVDSIDSDRSLHSAVTDVKASTARIAVNQPNLLSSPKKDMTSLERFARARAAGKELVEKNQEARLRYGDEEGVYYNPKVGDYVMGIVASGNHGTLDMDIGANKLGHLFWKNVVPLDVCNIKDMSGEFPDTNSPDSNVTLGPAGGPYFVHDEEVLNLALEAPMAVELGTVLTMEVKGITPSGRALLCARSVAREYSWQRVRQMLEYNATFEVQIAEWTPAGLVTKIEGLRAFLPLYYLVNRPPEPSPQGSVSYKEYVGQKFTVMISSIDEKRRSLVISEKKAWMSKNAYIGALVEGIVTNPIQPYGVHLRIKNTDISGVLHISNISRARVDNISRVFSIGEEVKAMVVPSNKQRRLSFSTADLEIEDGLMLRDKQAVFQNAEKIAAEVSKAYKDEELKPTVATDDNVHVAGQEIVIANWDWLDFGDRKSVV